MSVCALFVDLKHKYFPTLTSHWPRRLITRNWAQMQFHIMMSVVSFGIYAMAPKKILPIKNMLTSELKGLNFTVHIPNGSKKEGVQENV